MRKKVVLTFIIILIVLISGCINENPDSNETESNSYKLEWVEYWEGAPYRSVRVNSVFEYQGSIYVAALQIGQASERSVAILIKYDQNGTMIWNTTWGDEDTHNMANDVFGYQGNIYLVGDTDANGDDIVDTFISKFDQNGMMLWERIWDWQYGARPYSIFVINNGIYITGISYKKGNRDAFLLKYDQDGNLIWNRTWDKNLVDSANSVHGYDGRIYVTGSTGNDIESLIEDIFLLCYDFEGNLLWNRTFTKNDFDSGESVFANSDGVYITGWTQTSDYSIYDVILLKYDREGNLIWHKTFDVNDYDLARSIFIVDKNIYIAGSTNTISEKGDVLLLKLDKDGNLIQKWTWDSDEHEYANTVFVQNGFIYLGGIASSNGFLLKIKE
jgi:hypothetical protein